jgi:hypothetical protein
MSDKDELTGLRAGSVLERFRNTTYKLDAIVRALTLAKDAQGLPRVLALASVAGNILDALLPEQEPMDLLRKDGWESAASQANVVQLLKLELERALKPDRLRIPGTSPGDMGQEISVWRLGGKPAVILMKQWSTDMLMEREPGLAASILEGLWQAADALAVESIPVGVGASKLALIQLPAADPPVGRKAQELRDWLAEPSTRTRIVLIVGPTGAGKTTLARTALGTAKVLQVPEDVGHRAVMELAALLKPQVLLIDDIVLSGRTLDQRFAGLLDRLHGHVPVVLATLMDDSLTPESARRPGALYWPGMRAGRLDRVLFLPPPQADERRRILEHAGMDEALLAQAAELTEGLTGAFLVELVRRCRERSDELPDLVQELRAQAPASFSKEEDDDDD